MKKVILQDGSEMEVYEEADVNAAKSQVETTIKTELQQKIDALQKEKDTLMADDGNRNWAKIRATNQKLSDAVKAQGKQVDDDGNISEAPKPITSEEIEAKARSAARSEILGDYKKKALASYDEETRKVVDHYYNKLTAGEDVSLDNVDKFLSEASRLAKPSDTSKPSAQFGGKPPIFKGGTDGAKFAETDDGKKLANEIFGNDSFAKKS